MQVGKPRRGTEKAKNLGVSVAGEVADRLQAEAQKLGWTKSYLTEQILRNYLEMPSDYTWSDLELAKLGLLE